MMLKRHNFEPKPPSKKGGLFPLTIDKKVIVRNVLAEGNRGSSIVPKVEDPSFDA